MKSKSDLPTAVVCAAGCASRFDGLKQTEKVDGQPALQHVLDSLLAAQHPLEVVVVLGCQAERIKQQIDFYNFDVVINDAWKSGLSTSVQLGVKNASIQAPGYLFLLADMLLVKTEIIEEVIHKGLTGGSIVAPSYEGKRGFPVYFDKKWRDQLINKPSGDEGGRAIIRDNREELTLLETDDKTIILDIDTRADLEEL